MENELDIQKIIDYWIDSSDEDYKTMLETHTYSPYEFSTNIPIIEQIKQFGFRL